MTDAIVCGCGCGQVDVDTSTVSASTCQCGCGSVDEGSLARDEEMARLIRLRASIDDRLEHLATEEPANS